MGQPALKQDELYYTDMAVGEILRRTRTHYGQSLADIERALRIRSTQIEAIESGNLDQLPGRVYAIGFVRSYSEYLGLDGDRMVHLFKTQAGGQTHDPELHFPVGASDSKIPSIWLVLGCIAVTVFIGSGWLMNQSRDRTLVTEVPAVPETLKVAEPEETYEVHTVEMPADFTPEETIVSPPPEGIILNILRNSWVEIKDVSGKAVVSRVLNEGDQYYVPDRPDLTMSLGNAGGVELEVDGVKLQPLGMVGDVRRNIPLDAGFLKKTYAKDIEIGGE